MQSADELVLNIYHCPINDTREDGELRFDGGYVTFGNLDEVVRTMRSRNYDMSRDSILKKDLKSGEIYRCPKAENTFYDPKTKLKFLPQPIKINFYTFGEGYTDRDNFLELLCTELIKTVSRVSVYIRRDTDRYLTVLNAINTQNYTVYKHPELVDLREAMSGNKKLSIPKAGSQEFLKVCKKIKKRMNDPLARDLYRQKILNYQRNLFDVRT